MMNDNYTYPVVLDYSEEGFINIKIPDFEYASTCVENGGDYVVAAQEVISLSIVDCEDKGKDIPSPSLDIELKEGQKLVYVNVYMPYQRTQIIDIV